MRYICCIQQYSLTISLWRTIHSLDNSLSCLGVPILTLWPTTVICNLFLALEVSFGDDRCPFGTLLPPITYPFHLDLLHMWMFLESFCYGSLGFHMTHQIYLSFSCPLLYSNLHSFLSFPFDPPVLASPSTCVYCYLFCFLFLRRFCHSPLVSYSILNLCS